MDVADDEALTCIIGSVPCTATATNLEKAEPGNGDVRTGVDPRDAPFNVTGGGGGGGMDGGAVLNTVDGGGGRGVIDEEEAVGVVVVDAVAVGGVAVDEEAVDGKDEAS